MFQVFSDFASWLVYSVLGLSPETKLGDALHFFAEDVTKIFALLAFKAIINLFDAPMYLANFKTLKILNKRRALNAAKLCEPTSTKDKYFGIVDNKSIIP